MTRKLVNLKDNGDILVPNVLMIPDFNNVLAAQGFINTSTGWSVTAPDNGFLYWEGQPPYVNNIRTAPGGGYSSGAYIPGKPILVLRGDAIWCGDGWNTGKILGIKYITN